MNAAGIRALEQARGYYREGVVNATKRLREAEKAFADAEEQLAFAEEQVAELDAALEEAQQAPAMPSVTEWQIQQHVETHGVSYAAAVSYWQAHGYLTPEDDGYDAEVNA